MKKKHVIELFSQIFVIFTLRAQTAAAPSIFVKENAGTKLWWFFDSKCNQKNAGVMEPELYPESSQTSKMEPLAKIVNGFRIPYTGFRMCLTFLHIYLYGYSKWLGF